MIKFVIVREEKLHSARAFFATRVSRSDIFSTDLYIPLGIACAVWAGMGIILTAKY